MSNLASESLLEQIAHLKATIHCLMSRQSRAFFPASCEQPLNQKALDCLVQLETKIQQSTTGNTHVTIANELRLNCS